jgi:hypothetical protein
MVTLFQCFTGCFTGTWGNMPYMPIALNQLSDDIDALKSLVAEQLARNEQLQPGKQSVVKKNE